MGRAPCCIKVGLRKGTWTAEEDHKLKSYIEQHGHGSWRALPTKAGLERCGKSCRLRWINYLSPDIKRGKFSLQEQKTIIQLHALLGNRWASIASHLPKRTDNEVKNYWNTHLRKKLRKMGIDPTTHKPINSALISSGQSKDVANLSHVVQWESTRLEAEARIVRESKCLSNPYHSLMNKFSFTISPKPPPSPLPLPPPQRPPCLDILRAWQATKPRKDILTAIVNGGSLLSFPTSIWNFPENKLANTLVGLNSVNRLAEANYLGNPSAHTSNYREERGKGIMENSLQVHDDTMDLVITNDDWLKFPSFLEGFEDFSAMSSSIALMASNTSASAHHDSTSVGNEEDKVSYWSEILNVMNSPMYAPHF